MEAIYLYGIVEFPPELPREFRGLGGNPVSLLPRGGVAAVVSRSPLSAIPVNEAHLTRHAAIVEELMRSRPILPVRFGALLRGEKAVLSLLEERACAFRSKLEWLTGKVEMGLRVLWEPTESVAWSVNREIEHGGPGTEYLCGKLTEERRRVRLLQAGEKLIEDFQAPFLPLTAESRLQRFCTERLLLTAAYLVQRDRLDAFRGGVGRARREFRCLRLLLTGPWPPYHFVDCERPLISAFF